MFELDVGAIYGASCSALWSAVIGSLYLLCVRSAGL